MFYSLGRARSALTVGLLTALVMSGCSSGNNSSAPPAAQGGGATAAPNSPGASASGTPTPLGATVEVTSGDGYQFQVSLVGLRTMTSFTTDDGTGTGGTTFDAPPGKSLVVATLSFVNNSNRQEPFVFAGDGVLPNTDTTFLFEVPKADLAAFGIPDTDTNDFMFCGSNAPAGYCSLGGQIMGFSPASSDFTKPPELAPGATGTLTILPMGLAGTQGSPVPENAPVKDLKVFAEKTGGCDISDPSCAAALN